MGASSPTLLALAGVTRAGRLGDLPRPKERSGVDSRLRRATSDWPTAQQRW
jgi:hypothetical protein